MSKTDRWNSRKMIERIGGYRKEAIYDHYVRLVRQPAEYVSITRKKMVEKVYEIYDDYQNILALCTVRELKFLEKAVKGEVVFESIYDRKHSWETSTLSDKFLIIDDINKIFVPDEIVDKVKLALKKADWEKLKKRDEINEIVLGLAKMGGVMLLQTLATFSALLTNMSVEQAWNYIIADRMIDYYVFFGVEENSGFGEEVPIVVYRDYYDIWNEIDKRREKYAVAGVPNIEPKRLRNIFYYDFDISNKAIKTFLDEIEDLPILAFSALEFIREAAALNLARKEVKDAISSIPILENHDLRDFFKVMDKAMDEMPSAVLNGLTPKEVRALKRKETAAAKRARKRYVKQENACLSRREAKLFYKIYFGLLEFTNQVYGIRPGLKIYQQLGLDPTEIVEVMQKFWEEKEKVVAEFCEENPFDFNNNELDLARSFEKGKRGLFVIVRYERDYTAFLCGEELYMVKGVNDNLDNIISYKDLPMPVETAVVPFLGCLVYDGVLSEYAVSFGAGLSELVEKEYDKMKKIYYL